MRIYTLTPLGNKIAQSTSAPQSPSWQVVFHLRRMGHATPDSIATYVGINARDASSILGQLKRKGIVADVTSVSERA